MFFEGKHFLAQKHRLTIVLLRSVEAMKHRVVLSRGIDHFNTIVSNTRLVLLPMAFLISFSLPSTSISDETINHMRELLDLLEVLSLVVSEFSNVIMPVVLITLLLLLFCDCFLEQCNFLCNAELCHDYSLIMKSFSSMICRSYALSWSQAAWS